MKNKEKNKSIRKKLELEKEKEKYPDFCFCDGEPDFDENNIVGYTDPIDGYPHSNSIGYTLPIYICKKCGNKVTQSIVY